MQKQMGQLSGGRILNIFVRGQSLNRRHQIFLSWVSRQLFRMIFYHYALNCHAHWLAHNGPAIWGVCVTWRSIGQCPGTLGRKLSRCKEGMPCPDERSETGARFLESGYKFPGLYVYRGTMLINEQESVILQKLNKWVPVQCRVTN
jgi:hypothetical protein